MAKISLPVEATNQAIKDRRLGSIMQRAAERWKPEAMYYSTFDGQRTAFMVFDMADPSDMPPFAEPFFMELNADVQLAPVMNGADLEKGLSQLSRLAPGPGQCGQDPRPGKARLGPGEYSHAPGA